MADGAREFDPTFNCPTHFAFGDPTCDACWSKQPTICRHELPSDAIVLGEFCNKHGVEALKVLGMHDPAKNWRAGLHIAQLLMFGLVVDLIVDVDDAGATPQTNAVQREWRQRYHDCCLACAEPRKWDSAKLCLFKGLSHAAQVAQGKVVDPDCPLITPPAPTRDVAP